MLFFECLIFGFASTLGILIALGLGEAWKFVTKKTGGKSERF